jgi:hypothetical protein
MRIRSSRAALILALAAMMLRALMPMGWMPNPAGFTNSPLVICLMDTPSGLDTAQAKDMSDMDMPGMDMQGGGHDHGQQQNSQPCPFAAAPHIASAALIGEAPLPLLFARLAEKSAHETGLAHDRAYQPQAPRAPPYFA